MALMVVETVVDLRVNFAPFFPNQITDDSRSDNVIYIYGVSKNGYSHHVELKRRSISTNPSSSWIVKSTVFVNLTELWD